MKKKKLAVRLLAVSLSLSMAFGESTVVFANGQENVAPQIVVEEPIVEEPVIEEPVEEEPVIEEPVVEEPVEEEPVIEEPVEEEPIEEEPIEEEPVIEEPVVKEPVEEDTMEMFPGLADDTYLTAEEFSDKAEVAAYESQWSDAREGIDYVENEVVLGAESEEEALAYAKAFNGELESYGWGIAVITLNAGDDYPKVTVMDAVAASSLEDSILPAVWPNYYMSINETHEYNDPFLIEDSDSFQWHHSVINSEIAWAAGYRGAGTKVAVLDTGIKSGHEDVYVPENNIIVVNEEYGFEDGNDHGTHVAGIIAARGNNGTGGSGVAPRAELYSIKVLDDEGNGDNADIMRGINAAVEADVDIINMSLGGPCYSGEFDKVINDAYESGVAVFCAAGNEYTDSPAYPACYDKAISVAALNHSLTKAEFSNFGAKVRYCAPGCGIWSAAATESYMMMDGTSQATPVTVGAAAVLWGSTKGEGKERVDNLLALMDKNCTKVQGTGIGKGCIDLAKALGLSDSQKAPSKPQFNLKAGVYKEANITLFLSSKDGGCEIYYSTDGKPVSMKNGKWSDNAKKYSTPITIGGKTNVTVYAMAYSARSGLCSPVVSAKYTFKPEVEYIIVGSKTGATKVTQGKSLALEVEYNPDFAVNKKVNWSVTGRPEGADAKMVTVSTSGVVKVSKNAVPGVYEVVATLKNNDSVSGTFEVEVQKISDNPVIKVNAKKTNVSLTAGGTLYVEGFTVTRKDGTTEKLDVENAIWHSSNENVAICAMDDNGGAYIFGVGAGTAKFTIQMVDGNDKKVTVNITVIQKIDSMWIGGSHVLSCGKSITLKANITPETSTLKRLAWTVSPQGKGVSVVNGKVTASKNAEPGRYTVSASTLDGTNITKTHEVVVQEAVNAKLSLSTKSVSLFRTTNQYNAKNTEKIKVTCNTNWTVKNNTPGLIDYLVQGEYINIVATGKACGTGSITVMTTDGSNKTLTCKVTVKNVASKLLIAPESGRTDCLAYGTSMKLGTYFITNQGKISADSKKLEWKSENPDIISVDQNGRVTAKSYNYGGTLITATAKDGSGLKASIYLYTCDRAKSFALRNEDGVIDKVIEMKVGELQFYAFEMEGRNGEFVMPMAEAKVSAPGLSAGGGYGVAMLYANKPGTYKMTLRTIDGSNVKVVYTVKVTKCNMEMYE